MILDLDCARARRALEDRLDEPLDEVRSTELAAHLARCAGCREHDEGLGLVRRAILGLPVVPLPDEALRAVWRDTIESDASRSGFVLDWRTAAAAALIAGAALLSVKVGPERRSAAPTEAEIARAASDARLVFALTAKAMRRSEEAADRVLANEVSPAVRKIPLRWPEDSRRSGT